VQEDQLEYVGFWARTGASIIDSILMMIVCYPLLIAVYGWSSFGHGHGTRGVLDFLMTWVFPILVVLAFWKWKQATPGKMMIGARIVDAATGEAPSTGQMVGRYLGYFLSTIVFGLGFLWVAFDRKKQGWHDKLAGTVVVRPRGPEPVRFEGR
jgi:uncharacterized RDD family membrane protein YckC